MALSGRRILIADHDHATVELLAFFLAGQGYRVAAAADGNRALDMGSSGEFEVVVLDVQLPIYSGVEVVQLLRRRHLLRPLKILVLTADETPDLRDALEQHGIDGYMTKPIDLEKLGQEVNRLVAAGSERRPALAARMIEAQLRYRSASGYRADDEERLGA